ncbi:MAG: Cna B-type domain-containing protein, partial [Bacteroidales bacterium]|nr:Cna B-type domain-containing protein [Bacteroidales bacterium]
MKKKIFAMLMAVVLCVGMLPAGVLAEEDESVQPEETICDAEDECVGDVDVSSPEGQNPVEPETDEAEGVEPETDEAEDVEIDAAAISNDFIGSEESMDAETAAALAVDGDSSYTITWAAGNEYDDVEITVNLYDLDGNELAGEFDQYDEYKNLNVEVVEVAEIVSHLSAFSEDDDPYSFYYAGIGSYSSEGDYRIYGGPGEDNITQIERLGNLFSYCKNNVLNHHYGFSADDAFDLNVYYSLPEAQIGIAEGSSEHVSSPGGSVDFVAKSLYFQHLDASDSTMEYAWTVSDSALGTITNTSNEAGTATFIWGDDVTPGDQVVVSVTLTNTYHEDGQTHTETGTGSYTLVFGDSVITISCKDWFPPQIGDNPYDAVLMPGAMVSLVDGNGNTVYSAVSDEQGEVYLNNVEPGSYTVGISYLWITDANTAYPVARACGGAQITIGEKGEITLDSTETGTFEQMDASYIKVTLTDPIAAHDRYVVKGSDSNEWGVNEPYYFEHIDVKIPLAEKKAAGYSASFSNLESVSVYDKWGNLIYVSEYIVKNETQGYLNDYGYNYNVIFSIPGQSRETHSIVVSTDDTVVLTYDIEITEGGVTTTKTYTSTLTEDKTYALDEYYRYTYINAYKLYNAVYGAEITSDMWQEALESADPEAAMRNLLGSNYNVNGIPLSGLSYFQMAEYVCDEYAHYDLYQDSSQIGLDFVIAIEEEPTVTIEGTKIWNDENNNDGKRPESITITLLADGEAVLDENGDPVTATVYTSQTTALMPVSPLLSLLADDGNEWSWAFVNADGALMEFPKYNAEGNEIEYTVAETTVDGYLEPVITGNREEGYTVTNMHIPETTEVSGSKTWEDSDDQDGKRPESITINLLADGESIDSVTVTEADEWAWSFTGLPKYANGDEITYTITEDEVDEYTTEIDGFDVTNSYTPGKTGLNVQKIWDDADDQDGIRPAEVTVELVKNGEVTGITLTLDETNDWAGSFTDLDEYTDGEKNEYTVQEVSVDGYAGTVESGEDTTSVILTNTHVPETTEVSGSKTWEDSDD